MSVQEILDSILSVAGTALVSVACWLIAKGAVWLESKTKNESLVLFYRRLDDVAERVVKDVFQAYVDPLKKAGSWTPDGAAQAKAQALTKLKSYIGLDGLHMLEYLAGASGGSSIDSFLGTFVESAVHDLKLDLPPVPRAPLPAKSVPLPPPVAPAPASAPVATPPVNPS